MLDICDDEFYIVKSMFFKTYKDLDEYLKSNRISKAYIYEYLEWRLDRTIGKHFDQDDRRIL